jgi:hypothetical protein
MKNKLKLLKIIVIIILMLLFSSCTVSLIEKKAKSGIFIYSIYVQKQYNNPSCQALWQHPDPREVHKFEQRGI